MTKILVNYIYIGSKKRLEKLKFFKPFSFESISSIGFDKETELVELIDKVVADSSSNLVVLLPPGTSPNKSSREALKKMALINQLSWGWFKLNNKNKIFSKLKGIISSMNQIPTLEQGIFFSRDLYFSIGGIGKVMKSPFDEIGKRLYSRIDPQKPLPPLIIRSKKLDFHDMKLIEAKNISYKINDRNILNNISFVIDFGELVKISGDNGSGKTTLLKIIIGLTKQTKGELINHNEDKVCFLGHKNNLKNYLSIRENLMIQGLSLDSFNLDLLEKFNLRRHIDNSVGTLSFGQQKKLSLVRVLNSDENILILDEPFVGLDQNSKEFLKNFMEAEVKKNKTIIFTSHIDFKDDYREIKINE